MISKAVDDQLVRLLSDASVGLNPTVVAICQRDGVTIPLPGVGGTATAPIDFSPGSAQFFKVDTNVDVWEQNSAMQYPALFLSFLSAVNKRPSVHPRIFFGVIRVRLALYLAWPISQPAQGNDFDQQLHAFEEAFFSVVNYAGFRSPVIYNGDLDVTQRTPLVLSNKKQLWRRGMLLECTVRVEQQASSLA